MKKLLPAMIKKRPWPLPQGWKYCDKGYKLFRIKNGKFVRVSFPKFLMARSTFGSHRFVTPDNLVAITTKSGIAEPIWDEPVINLPKPI